MEATAYYRVYELPWEADPEEQRRFRIMLLAGVLLLAILAVILHFTAMPISDETAEQAVPPRLAKLMQKEVPKPPPPPPPVLPKPPLPKEVPKPVDTRKKMEQNKSMKAIKDTLADLRDQLDMTALQQKNLTGQVNADSRAERSLIASKVGTGAAANVTANASRGFGTGAGSLTGHDTMSVRSGIGDSTASAKVSRTGNSGKASRGAEEIELIFDRNKGAIYALYNRALRDRPELMGKLVLELTISPAGDVTACRLISSELNESTLEGKIVARVKLFKFEARDVEPITVKKTIEFFPQ
jgi:outer membrane biosynthesis protein TonB